MNERSCAVAQMLLHAHGDEELVREEQDHDDRQRAACHGNAADQKPEGIGMKVPGPVRLRKQSIQCHGHPVEGEEDGHVESCSQ